MQSRFVLILFMAISFTNIQADTINFKNGKTLEGQLLKVSDKYLIIEILSEDMRIETISIDRNSVKSIVDESKVVLFEDGKTFVDDLDDYYRRFYQSASKLDTIVFKSGQIVSCSITSIKDSIITYNIRDKSKQRSYIATFGQIEKVNGIKINNRNSFITFPIERKISYPHFSLALGFSSFLQNLNDYKKLYKDLEIETFNNETYNLDSLEFRTISKSIYAINFGLSLHINQNFIISSFGHFTLGFGNNKGYHDKSESFRLFLGELKYLFPFESISPWAAVGYSFQSVTIINNYSQFNLKFNSSSSSVSLASGVNIKFNSQYGCVFAFRYLPFGKKDVLIESNSRVKNIRDKKQNSKIDFTNLMLSASFFINL